MFMMELAPNISTLCRCQPKMLFLDLDWWRTECVVSLLQYECNKEQRPQATVLMAGKLGVEFVWGSQAVSHKTCKCGWRFDQGEVWQTYRSAWHGQTLKSYPLCYSSSGGGGTGTGTHGSRSWRPRRCTACGPGTAGTTSSGLWTSQPTDCRAAVRLWCKPRESAADS